MDIKQNFFMERIVKAWNRVVMESPSLESFFSPVDMALGAMG